MQMFFKHSQEGQGQKIEDRRNFSSLYNSLLFLFPSVTLVAALVCYSTAAQAQTTTLPSSSGLNFQTSGPSRPAGIGDWYTTATSNSPDRLHRFAVDITQAMITAGGGSVTITINDAESNGVLDEINSGAIGAVTCTTLPSTCDPTRFELRTLDGVTVLQTQTVGGTTGNNAPNNTPVTFTVTQPGTYQVTSVTGAGPIFGINTASLNNDDNGFSISVPTFGLPQGQQALIGQFQGTVQQNTGSALNVPLYFLVDPGTISLSLRNFDLDEGGSITYTRPTGGTISGTESDDAEWNGSNTLDPIPGSTGDNFAVSALTATGGDAGIWGLTVAGFTNNNQTLFQAAGNLGTLPLFDKPPTRAGNFVITPSTTLETTIGNEVCHPFTVTNNFFTTDIINLNLTGTNPNYVAQFRDAATGLPLTDTDGDELLDTGILNPGQTKSYNLCVTPGAGATAPDVSQIRATSFMDRKVDPNGYQTREQFVTKTTTIPTPPVVTGTKSVALAIDADGSGSVTGGDRIRYTITYTNTGPSAATNFQIVDTLPVGLTLFGTPTVTPAGPGTNASVNTAYNGASVNTLLNPEAVLAPSGTITVTVEATVGSGVTGNLFNQATASSNTPGFPPGGVPTDATTPQGNIDQSPYPNQGSPSTPTGITVGSAPVPLANKSVRFVKDNDGTQTLTIGDDLQYTIIVRNPTNTPINNLVVSDVIPVQLLVVKNSITISGGFTAASSLPNNDFNGTGNPIVLTNPGTLAANSTVTLTFNARILPGSASPITNQGRVNYAGDNGNPVLTDASDSTNPTAPGSNNNPGDPGVGTGNNVSQPTGGPNDPTIIKFISPFEPSGTKSVRLFTDADNNGVLTTNDVVEYTVTYTNSNPSTVITNFLATDPLPSSLAFVPGSYSFTFSGNGTTVTGNSNYNGTTDTNLTNANPSGALGSGGGQVVIKFRARVTAGANTTITNQASATSVGGLSPSITDAVAGPSDLPQGLDDGTNQGNLGPTGDDDPTLLSVVATPIVSGTKSVALATDADGTGSVTPGDRVRYTIIYTNTGSGAANEFQITDALPTGLTLAVTPTVTVAGTGSSAAINTAYNGVSINTLLAAGAVLAPNGTITVTVDATVGSGVTGNLFNQATATSTTPGFPSGGVPTDANTPSGSINQAPYGDTGSADKTGLTIAASGVPRLRLVKRITNATRNSIPVSGINFGSFLNEPNDTNDDASGFSQLSPIGVTKIPSENALTSGDEVEYTIYFLSDGGSPVNNVRFCDAIPSGTTFIANSFGSGSGISLNRAGTVTNSTNASDTDAGGFLSPLAPLPTGNACSTQTNPDGSVIVNLGDVSNVAGSNFGFIRFRVKIN
ncbi:isopeptide-forming domain-containing fimbrial protein [Coleofasciculus sp. FACHB-1120]|uniref:beta strand repeat-containing protein n=1 Tax=Coleofasciculus sp. FACHB-1120 TaxID=2692783 RepID=UPI001687D78A|nr:isopeptide-forming domain-containing fimbrial protein [Coleofasciculus sp. FACHB-1120]MBD2740877.1 isopeptide-forming domain-containing fimbrial protein [Coleofasciculus sp. FACHB-1120]